LPFEACLKVRAESFELSKTDSLANFDHHVKVKVEVVVGVQDCREKFTSGIKMAQIGTGVSAANRALTFFVYGPLDRLHTACS
jgi:curli biogenesis system outer membrane secretion channel CsgG